LKTLPVLELARVTRTFPGIVALRDVSFELVPGEVHALVGENGAGKSTLINLVSGVLKPDRGELLFEGQGRRITDPVAARGLGIVTVHQEADFFPTLSVAENLALLHGLPTNRFGTVSWHQINESARRSIEAVGEAIDVTGVASGLSVAHRHMAQIAAAVLREAKIVVLDEPTSALTAVEAQWLFEQVARLKTMGAGIVYISHRQEEIFDLADRITVLRDGERVWTRPKQKVTPDGLVQAMIGREIVIGRQPITMAGGVETATSSGPYHLNTITPRLGLIDLTDADDRFRHITFDVKSGEIVGIYGLVGAGRSEIAQAVFGLTSLASGEVKVDGHCCDIRKPQDAVRAGIAYVPEDRLHQGLCRTLSIRANMVLSTLAQWGLGPLASRRREREATRKMVGQLGVRQRTIEQPVNQLSGGNQQKVVLGRWLLAKPKVLLLDEPTRGVDVGAKAEIHQLLRRVAKDGCAVVMISSELPEIMQHSDRIIALRSGEIAATFNAADATAAEVAKAALPRGQLEDQVSPDSTAWHRQRLPSGELGLLAVVSVLVLWIGLTTDGFFLPSNLAQLLADTALWTILGLSAAIVIIVGGIDISIGSLLALAAASAGLVLKLPLAPTVSIPLAILVGLVVASAGGFVNGALSLVGRVHPIVVTLGMMILYRGLVIALLRGNQINYLPRSFGHIAIHAASGFRGTIVLGATVAAVVYWFLAYSRFGRHIYALGSSRSAARLAGISPGKTWMMAFTASGLLIGLAAVFELSSSMQMQAQLAQGWELQAIAVAVIGGVSITGGRGNVLGVMLGALLLQLVSSALIRWEVSGDQTQVVVGGMILAAVLSDLIWRKLERKTCPTRPTNQRHDSQGGS